MASSNRHWPSMFKSKPCNSHQWNHDINQSLLSGGCLRTPYNSVGGCEERSPEPKPRWNPKPEQIRILEAIFNSGMVNPPRDEIRKIRAQLQEFGQVGDANVFYWFQNRKSRSKHKLRHHHTHNHNKPTTNNKPSQYSNNTNTSTTATTTNSNNNNNNNNIVLPNTSSFEPHIHFQPSSPMGQGLNCFPTTSHVHSEMGGGPSTSLNLLSEIMNHHSKDSVNHDHDHIGVAGKLLELNFTAPSTTIITTTSIAPLTAPGSTSADHAAVAPISAAIGQLHGVGEGKSTVFINDVAFEVGVGPFNVREAFGEEAVLINSYGHPLLTDEWGLTLHSLQHGACYYLI